MTTYIDSVGSKLSMETSLYSKAVIYLLLYFKEIASFSL